MTRKKTETPKETFPFETALEELNALVEKMEKGDLPLETALQCFERGIALTRRCQRALKEAEQKVQRLVEKNGETTLAPFAHSDAADEEADTEDAPDQ